MYICSPHEYILEMETPLSEQKTFPTAEKLKPSARLAQCINLYGHMTSSLIVDYQNDILMNFLLTSIEILISDNFVCLPPCLLVCIYHNLYIGSRLYFSTRWGFTIAQSF